MKAKRKENGKIALVLTKAQAAQLSAALDSMPWLGQVAKNHTFLSEVSDLLDDVVGYESCAQDFGFRQLRFGTPD